VSVAVKCPNCGAKISAEHARCPRCRAVMAAPDPAIASQRSRRLMITTIGLVLVFGAGLLFLWYTGRSGSSSAPAETDTTASGTRAAGSTLEPEFLEWAGSSGGAQPELQKKLEEAKRAAADSPKDGNALRNLGRIQLQLRNGTDAIASFQAASDVDPQSSEYRFALAEAQCGLARWDECINSLRDARKLAPEHAALSHNLGVALHRRGVDDVAVDEFKKARELASGQPLTVLGLAVSYDKLGRSADAVEAYQEFLRLAPASPLAEKIRVRLSQLGSGA
jgi:tetratricopeptide (TPR) repeat protein